MSLLTHKVCLFGASCCVIWQAKIFRHKSPKDNPLQEARPWLHKLGRSMTPSQRLSAFPSPLLRLGASHSHPLPARAFDHPGQCPCLKHWSRTGAMQQTGSSVLGEVVTHFPSQQASVPSLPHLWHANTSTYTIRGSS